jgi:hypothetical protein
MSKQADCLAYDEEADAEPVAPLMVKTAEGVEDFLHFLFRDAADPIEDVDADVATNMAAAHENATAGLGILTALPTRLRSTVPRSKRSLMIDALVETVLISIPFRKAASSDRLGPAVVRDKSPKARYLLHVHADEELQ